MEIFSEPRFQLLRLAARFRPTPESNLRNVDSKEIASVIAGLMSTGIYVDEFAYLEDPQLNYFQMLPVFEEFLGRLNWKPLSEEAEFRFLTAAYATEGAKNDVSAYHAIRRWMEDVGRELPDRFSVEHVADGIEAGEIYGCYYSYSNVAGHDLIQSVGDPQTHDWSLEGSARPKEVLKKWLADHPNDYDRNRPFNEKILDRFLA